METAKKAKSKARPAASAAKIEEGYREFLLTEGKTPQSVFSFCKSMGMKENEFYEYFASFEAIESGIWKRYADDVKSRLMKDADYVKFSAREKILSFYYSLVEVLKADRSFVLYLLKTWKNPAIQPAYLKGFHASFEAWANGVVAEGKNSGEIAKRPFLDERYHHLLWLHLLFILQFWSHDDSANFDKTDAAIEKSVNLAFDLIGKGILDNAIDFGKFLYQNSKN
jgi:AcrR family transcriptional regulator